ncbi:hypothetical protein B6S59_25340 [Pseudomonas sp. A46]|nr:LPO_1073/Vpar_1526 family protein [Pseudomonas sp. A46]OWJ91099.1 hypothetical protein B6S59_25340 [Pseudomonas sp. A46]
MIGPKQSQDVQGEGTAIQAGRDVHYHGLQVAEVRELTEIFLERQLPALRAEAVKAMRENAQELVEKIVTRLATNPNVSQEAFAKPDAQVCFNEALKAGAEKGDQIDMDMLADMVVGRLESDDDPLIKLIYEDAVKVLPRLTAAHVAFLGYLTWMRTVTHTNMQTLQQFEHISRGLVAAFSSGFELSLANKEYLVSVGVITINHVSDADNSFGSLREKYSCVPETKDQLAEQAPSLHRLIDVWGKGQFPMCHLNGTGKLIGLLALQRVFGKLNLSVWLN